jgi:hypothetical protein
MKAWDEDRPPVVFARVTDRYWLDDDGSDCRWGSALLHRCPPDPAPLTETRSGSIDEHIGSSPKRPPELMDRARIVIVPFAMVTVLIALALVTLG